MAGSKSKDLNGQKFTKLTPVSIHKRTGRNGTYWNCLCDCGKECIVNANKMLTGKTKSCGCIAKEISSKKFKTQNQLRILPEGEATFNHTYSIYKDRAKKKNLMFSLSKEDFRKITQQNCIYCGKEPSCVTRSRFSRGNYTYNTIDRMNNDKGYTLDNAVAACLHCNLIKGYLLTFEETKVVIGALMEFRKSND